LCELSRRVERLLLRIAAAEARSGRERGSVRMVAVVKLVPDEVVREALDLGLTDLGENRVQSLLARPPEIARRARLHLIGPLQTNKVRKAAQVMAEFHALDRAELVLLLEREAAARGAILPVWVQVNVAREPQKHGCAPAEAAPLVELAAAAPHLALRGLMTIAPLFPDPEQARASFRALADLSRKLRDRGSLPSGAAGLSMGMSNDFEVAIEEGATVVRVGSALFGRDAA
jgi:hypothetical protein